MRRPQRDASSQKERTRRLNMRPATQVWRASPPSVGDGRPGRLGRRTSLRVGVDHDKIALAVMFGRDLHGLRSGRRQRHMPAGLDQIELTWDQHHEPATMTNARGDATSFIARAPVDIRPRRADDRRARVCAITSRLNDERTLHARDRQIGFDKERCPVIMLPVDRNGPARRQWHALPADGLALVR